jgi:SAM-dependent methyltransferase
MIETANPEINVEDLMRRIREEVARRQDGPVTASHRPPRPVSASSSAPVNLQMETIQLPRFGDTASDLSARQSYTLSDFLNFHDEAFIRNAYRAILHREPDVGGLAHYLTALRSGRYTKAEILGRLRYSSEGRSYAVRVRGLFVPFAFQMAYHLPVLGYVFAWANFILRLPSIVRNWSRFEAFTAFLQYEQTQQLNQLAEQAEQSLRVFWKQAAEHEYHRDQQLERWSEETKSHINILSEQKADSDELADLRTALDDKATLSALQQALAELAAKADQDEVNELRDRLTSKADTKQLASIEANLFVLGETAENLLHKIQYKVDAGQLDTVRQALDAKADAGQLDAVRQALDAKADAGQLDAVRQALDAKADTSLIDIWNARLATRADAEQLASLVDHVQTSDKQTHATLADIQRQVLDHKRNIIDQQRRLALLLEEARKRLPEPIAQEQIENMVSEEDHRLDAFYVSFEDCFRGTREDIKQRMEIYLPIVREAKAGGENASILDIGCGRGEWLELLKDAGLEARGIDLNRVMVGQCQELGLEVIEADAISYLRKLDANSLGAVTGMHIIEHIPFKRLIVLFDEVFRTLKPGGVAIFETPNPENLITGACNFYYDPTHLNPLPPDPMRFVMEIRGFCNIKIMRLHPYPEEIQFDEGPVQMLKVLNNRLFGAQDYALVAYKA